MRSTSRLPLRGKALATLLGFAALLGGADTASAQSTAHPAAGALALKNVRIEHAPHLAGKPLPAPASGMRAYIDPVTGELRDQTPEEAAEGGVKLASPGPGRAKSTFTSPLGGVIAELDESHMMNSVAVRDASGKLRMQCVPGAQVNGALRAAGKEHGHAH